GIAWIGTSFYFNWLNSRLAPPPPERREPGVAGELWSVHGGGFYRVVKYTIAPGEVPRTLHWFKWEAYATWLTGFALLVLVYYVGAASFLVDPQSARLSPGAGVAVGVAALIVSWLVYDALCRSALGARPLALAAQQLSHAPGAVHHGEQPLPRHLRPQAQLGDPRGAGGDRGRDALLVQPAEPGPEERLDPPCRRARHGGAGARYGATVGSRV